jgi:hypothetical protein
MRTIKLLFLVVTCMCGATLCLSASEPDTTIAIRVASYNVEFGKSATPEQIGEMFKPYKLDIIGFNEAPDGDWTARVGKVLGMKHSYVKPHVSKGGGLLIRTEAWRVIKSGMIPIPVKRQACWALL